MRSIQKAGLWRFLWNGLSLVFHSRHQHRSLDVSRLLKTVIYRRRTMSTSLSGRRESFYLEPRAQRPHTKADALPSCVCRRSQEQYYGSLNRLLCVTKKGGQDSCVTEKISQWISGGKRMAVICGNCEREGGRCRQEQPEGDHGGPQLGLDDAKEERNVTNEEHGAERRLGLFRKNWDFSQ